MIKSPKEFLIGTAVGVVIALVLGGLYLRYPLLTSDSAKASYAIGQKIARDHRRMRIEFDPWIAAAAMKDGQNEDSMLDSQELNRGMRYIHTNSNANRQEILDKDKEGFVSRFGIRFKPKSDHFDLVQDSVPDETLFQFHVVVYNSKKKVVFSTLKLKEPVSVQAREIPTQMKFILNSIKKGESLEVKLRQGIFHRLKLEIPNDPAGEFIYEIQKLN